MVRGRMVGRINFVRIVAASIQPVDIVIAEVSTICNNSGSLAKKLSRTYFPPFALKF